MSRTMTRSFMRGGSRGAAPARQPLEARGGAVDSLAHRVHAAQELLTLVARHQMPALVREVVGEIGERGRGSLRAPGQPGAGEAAELMRGHVAEDQRQLLLGIGPEERAELAEL